MTRLPELDYDRLTGRHEAAIAKLAAAEVELRDADYEVSRARDDLEDSKRHWRTCDEARYEAGREVAAIKDEWQRRGAKNA